MSLTAIRIKANAHYQCQECGSTELIQAHHKIPGDDDSLIALCAECHSKRHPDLPRGLFFKKNAQPYWYNKSASSLAKELGVHSRTVIRAVKRLKILPGELSPWDEELIRNNIPKLLPKIEKPKPEKKPRFPMTCNKCSYYWLSRSPDPWKCPKCYKAFRKRIKVGINKKESTKQPIIYDVINFAHRFHISPRTVWRWKTGRKPTRTTRQTLDNLIFLVYDQGV